MRVPDDFPREPNPRLYNGVISSLKMIRALCLMFSVFLAMASLAHGSSEAFLKSLILALTVYIPMTSCIAIIDLLSRIEYNTRQLRQID